VTGYRFRILPPWYRTYTAYFVYVVTLLLLFYLGIRFNSRRLMAAKERLEIIVKERTAEVVKQKDELEIKNVEITRQKNAIENYSKELTITNENLITTKNALWGEMELAKKIQTVLLPKEPRIPGYNIAAYMKPADEVGGDYYDVIEVREEKKLEDRRWKLDSERDQEKDGEPCRGGSCDRPQDSGQSPKTNPKNPSNLFLGELSEFAPIDPSTLYHLSSNLYPSHWLTIGDVSGHGVPAGLVMMMVQTAIRLIIREKPQATPAQILQSVNLTIHENIQKLGEDKYMTITLMSVQADGTIFYSGLHQDILIFRAKTKDIEVIETKGMWIGMIADLQGMLTVDQITLHPGDTMLLYTDGITEAADADGTMFSEEKLAHIFKDLGSLNPSKIKENLLHNLRPYSCADDITFLILKKN
jgi:serine phosphatase RsbU (regulator of sigma subunit)